MSTRCWIGKENKDKTVTYIYCHSNGYPEGVGKTLSEFYKDEETIDKLLSLGGLSYLGEKPESNENYWKDTINPFLCLNYSKCGAYKDRVFENGERDEMPTKTVKNKEEYLNSRAFDIEYVYLWRDGKWEIF